jgi:hypothetical protein
MKPTIITFIATSFAMTLVAKHPVPQECLRTCFIAFVSRVSGQNLTGIFDHSATLNPYVGYFNCKLGCYEFSLSES